MYWLVVVSAARSRHKAGRTDEMYMMICVVLHDDLCGVRRRLQDCKKELHDLLKQEKLAGTHARSTMSNASFPLSITWHLETGSSLFHAGATLLVFANKQDLPGALGKEDIAKILELSVIGESRHWRIEACSAVTGKGLVEGVDWLVTDVASRIFMME